MASTQTYLKALTAGLAMPMMLLAACTNDVVDADYLEEDIGDVIVNPGNDGQALSAPSCGTVLASFDGTSAYSNGANTGTGNSCRGQGGIANGLQYQCVELVMRHFKRKWNLRWYGNAKDLLRNAPRADVNVYYNGDKAHPPVPGDLIVWETGQWGHTALVTAVGNDYVDIIEQNVSNSNGKARLGYNKSTGKIAARWNGWVPSGWAHAKVNTATGGGSSNSGGSNSGGSTSSCGKISKIGGIIDDGHACFDVGGTASYWRAVSGKGYGNDLLWTHAFNGQNHDNNVVWRLDLARAGKYRIEAYVDRSVATSKQAKYRVRHNGTVDEVRLDQSTATGWRSLGSFQFAKGGDQRVFLGDNSGEAASSQRKIVFDAIRVTPVCDSLKVETDNNATLNVRKSASASAERLGSLNAGDVVTRVGTVDGQSIEGTTVWHKVKKGSLEGFVSGAFIGCP